MQLIVASYPDQAGRWPETGRHIMAQFDDRSVVVYQAFRPEIARFAAEHGYFGDEFSYTRMSWVKTSFLWMMYRSNWGTNENQEAIVAVWLRRDAFLHILANAVHASFPQGVYSSRETWQVLINNSDVRVQWDPDHDPAGEKVERRAIQLGIRGAFLRQYGRGGWIERVEDITPFVAEQRQIVQARNFAALRTPLERPFPVLDPAVHDRLQMDTPGRPSVS
ncbi:MAG TPA: DUF4291 domain-containing protein [Aggregatilinea sp.]|uniref:DUF4291 domain-containing protein n=1 Tax=Aggregatilinea sp. TaxID=2806333 RepID=UPI002C730D24|nr:DUF4291 domain-containing protein [Aggregatilinea sp.]HML21517.1 DUF4291 domain-containing protein [Aggregatilinea sp.]